MELKFIEDTVSQYNLIREKIKSAALEKETARAGKDTGYLRYLIFQGFYIEEDGEIEVTFGFDSEAPYRDEVYVILRKEEVEKL